MSLLRSNADRIAWERTSSGKRRTTPASVRLCVEGKFCRNKSCATLMPSAIMRSELIGKTHAKLGYSRSVSLVVATLDFNIYKLLA